MLTTPVLVWLFRKPKVGSPRMDIKGWVRNSLIDYPEHIATVLFTGECNFRCPMCHNVDLVLHHEEMQSISAEVIFSFLHKRAGLIDGVVVSGGEPTLQSDLLSFLGSVKDLGFDIKLDTNGFRPDIVAEALRRKLADFIALDIKAPLEKYATLSGLNRIDTSVIENSVRVLMDAGVDFELRTTVVPQLVEREDIAAIAQWLTAILPENNDRGRYVLQQFRGSQTLDPGLTNVVPYTRQQLYEMAEEAHRWLPFVSVRGV